METNYPALNAARDALHRDTDICGPTSNPEDCRSAQAARVVLGAITKPELGLDRMVSVREVAQAFRSAQESWVDPGMSVQAKALAMENMGTLAAAFVERELGGETQIAKHDRTSSIELGRVGRVEVSRDGGPWEEVDVSDDLLYTEGIILDTSQVTEHWIRYRIRWEEA